jgi:hypothetical protein
LALLLVFILGIYNSWFITWTWAFPDGDTC